jgi:LysR family transcriptional regulator, nitrogen assimilation regulatory protein
MELRQLRYFICVSEQGSFTAAADELHVSQPALGTQVKKLEQELGVDLLNRTFQGVELTKAGERFLSHARDILEKINFATRDISEFQGTVQGTVNIGVTPSSGRVLIPSILDECSNRYPEIVLSCRQGYSDEMIKWVKNGDLNLAFSHEDGGDENLTAIPMLAQELCLIGPPDVIGPNGETIEFSELSQYSLIQERKIHATRNLLERTSERLNISLDIMFDADPVYMRKQMMESYKRCTVSVYGLFHDEVVNGKFSARPIDAPEMTRVLYIIKKGGEKIRPAERIVLDLIKKQIKTKIAEGMYHWHEPDWRPKREQKLRAV